PLNPLNSVTASGATISLGNADTSGAQSYTGATSTTLNGTYLAGDVFSVTGATLLGGATSIDTTNAGATSGADISFSGTVDNAQTLSLTAGTIGNITLGDVVGGLTP